MLLKQAKTECAERNAQFNHKLDNGKKMDDVTFASIDILAMKDQAWNVTAIENPCVPFDTSLPLVNWGYIWLMRQNVMEMAVFIWLHPRVRNMM
jgi:hypothetical protein